MSNQNRVMAYLDPVQGVSYICPKCGGQSGNSFPDRQWLNANYQAPCCSCSEWINMEMLFGEQSIAEWRETREFLTK